MKGTDRLPNFEVLEHTADIGVRAYGETLPDLFVAAALGVQSIALESERIEPRIACVLKASGEDLGSLLVNWLNELIYFIDARRMGFVRFDFTQFSEYEIVAQAWGEQFDPERHRVQLVVKAATYHLLRIAAEQGRWVAEVYLDI